MRHSTALFGLLLLAGAAAQAEEDGRITVRLYEPTAIVSVHGKLGIQSTIAFAADERIENVAVGDSSSWQVTPNKRADLLFVKPMTPRARTNMTVVTDTRTYLFDLVSGAGGEPVYMLRFTYPPAPKPPPPTPAQIAALAAAAAAASPPPAPAGPPPSVPTALDFAWTPEGDARLLPARAFDDGHATYLSWPKDAAVPAILARDAAGGEGPVNYSVKGDYVVIDGVPNQIVLRLGKQMATLTPAPRPAAAAADPASAGSAAAPLAHVADGRP